MSNNLANQLLMFSAEAIVTALLVLGLFRLRTRFGLSPLFVTLGVFQPIQVILASSIYVEVLPGLAVSPGSIIMFTASLFAVLLVYIREDTIEARKVIYGIMIANLTMTLLLLIFGAQLNLPDTLNFLGLPPGIFNQGARVMSTGTIVLFADVLLVIIVYEWVRHLVPRSPFLRIYLTMAAVLVFDSLGFATGAFIGQPLFRSILLAGILGKTVMALYYAAALTLYLRFIEPTDRVSLATDQPVRDIFYALTFREKYEIERQQASAERIASETRFRDLLEAAPDGMVIVDTAGEITLVNAQLEVLFGYNRAELIGQPVEMLILQKLNGLHPSHRIEFVAAPQVRAMGQDYELYAQRKNGTQFPVEIRLSPQETEAGLTVIAAVRDISERKQAEDEIRVQALQNEQILKTMLDGFILADTEGLIESINPSYCALVGYAEEELLQMNIRQLETTIPPEEVERRIAQMVSQGADRFETQHRHKGGRLIDLDVSIVIMQSEKNPLVAAFVHDISERKQAEEALQQAHDQLELRVRERTDELQRTVNLMAGREIRMKELRAVIKKLRSQLEQAGLRPVANDPLLDDTEGN